MPLTLSSRVSPGRCSGAALRFWTHTKSDDGKLHYRGSSGERDFGGSQSDSATLLARVGRLGEGGRASAKSVQGRRGFH